jgi:hypothetical protein
LNDEFRRSSRIRTGEVLLLLFLAGGPLPGQGAAPLMVISEIHFHPSDAQGEAEFIEFYNPGTDTVDLTGWRLSAAVDFVFRAEPAPTVPPGGYLVAAVSPPDFAMAFPGVPAFGPLSGRLANDGERIRLRDPEDAVVAEVEYYDDPPWPEGTDGTGKSLELLDPLRPNGEPANWRAGGPTPGAVNSVAGQIPALALFEEPTEPRAPSPGEAVRVSVRIFSANPVDQAKVTWQAGASTFSTAAEVALRDDGLGGDEVGGDGVWSAVLPAQPNLTVVRYWFNAKAGSDTARLPDPSALTSNFAYFVYDDSVATGVPLYFLFMEPAALGALDANPGSDVLRPAVFVHQGTVWDRIGVRYRGAWARSWPKKSWKIVFNRDHPFLNRQRRINLNSGWHDPAFIREKVSYDIHAAAGALASQTRFVRMHLNRVFHGVYTEIEQPDERYLDRQGFGGAAWYKADSPSNESDERLFSSAAAYQTHYEKEAREEESYDDLFQFCKAVDAARTSSAILSLFTERADATSFATYLAALAVTQNWDAYNKNHFIGHDEAGIWFMGPWDLDRTLGDHWDGRFNCYDLGILLGTSAQPGVTGWNRMMNRFLAQPDLLALYHGRLRDVCLVAFTESALFPRIDALVEQAGDDIDLDRAKWNGDSQGTQWRAAVSVVKSYIANRRAFILGSLPGVTPDAPVNLDPPEGGLVDDFPVVLKASPFSCAEAGAVLWSSRWQVRVDGGTWSTPTIDVTVMGSATQAVLDSAPPPPGQKWFFRVAYTSSSGRTSAFSEDTSFETGTMDLVPRSIDLTPFFDVDAVADPGDTSNDAFDLYGRLFLVEGFDGVGPNPAARGLPPSGIVGNYVLGDYGEPNAIRFTSTSAANPEIPIPPGSYAAVTLAVTGGGGDTTLAADLVYEDGDATVRLLADYTLDDPVPVGPGGGTLRAGLLPLIDGMDWWGGAAFESLGDVAFFEWGIGVDSERALKALRIRPKGTGSTISGKNSFDIFAVTAWAVPGSSSDGPFLRGDVDGTGRTDLSDAIGVLDGLFGTAGPFSCADAADADDSGRIDLTDAVAILEYLFLSGPPPAAPGPEDCGIDPTPDTLGGCPSRC